MKINTWFENGCDYHTGIALYAQQKGHSPNLLRLFYKKESVKNLDKLIYELGKYRGQLSVSSDQLSVSRDQLSVTSQPLTAKSQQPKTNNQPPIPKNYFYQLNQLHPDLHELSIKQRNDYQVAISLHSKLTSLHATEEGAALALCIQIEDLFDAIETTQKVLDYYVQNKIVLDISTRNYNDYTGGQLADARRNKRTSVAKFNKKVNELTTELSEKLTLSKKTKLTVALQKATEKLYHHEIELQQLNDLINER